MPIYAYKCESCGFAKDVLQKLSDAPLSDCPACGQASFRKQLTAAGFQLKGSGWYATDFKGGPAPAADKAAETGDAKTEVKTEVKTETKPATVGTEPATKKSPPAPSASAGTCSGPCACH